MVVKEKMEINSWEIFRSQFESNSKRRWNRNKEAMNRQNAKIGTNVFFHITYCLKILNWILFLCLLQKKVWMGTVQVCKLTTSEAVHFDLNLVMAFVVKLGDCDVKKWKGCGEGVMHTDWLCYCETSASYAGVTFFVVVVCTGSVTARLSCSNLLVFICTTWYLHAT